MYFYIIELWLLQCCWHPAHSKIEAIERLNVFPRRQDCAYLYIIHNNHTIVQSYKVINYYYAINLLLHTNTIIQLYTKTHGSQLIVLLSNAGNETALYTMEYWCALQSFELSSGSSVGPVRRSEDRQNMEYFQYYPSKEKYKTLLLPK